MLTVNFDPFPILTTERLTLRAIKAGDAGELFALRSDARVMRYLDRAPAEKMEEAERSTQLIMDLTAKNEAITWAITLSADGDDGKMIGNIVFWKIDKENYRAEIGYMLHPDYQGRGIMGETLGAVLRYGFEQMKLHSVEANVNPENAASIKLLERNGFVREAYFKENFYFDGRFLDSAIYSLLTPNR